MTPRTDRASWTQSGECVDADHARDLERDLREARELMAKTVEYLKDDLWVSGEARVIQRERAAAFLQRMNEKDKP